MDRHDGGADWAPGLPVGRSADGAYAGAAEDAGWVEAARAGDEGAFGRLFDRWFDPVYDVAWRIVRDPDTAAEVAQDVFLAAWQGLHGLEQPGSFGGWVRRIARNRALNRLDRDRRSVPDDEQAAAALDRAAPDVDLTAALGEQEQRELVWAAASALGERDASVLNLHLRHGFGAGEIADELGVTTNNAHQLLFRLKGKLGGAIRAWVLWRSSGPGCAALDRAISDAGLTTFGPEAVRVIGRHAEGCAACTGRQDLRLAPEALFAAMPIAVAPPLLRAEAAAALGQAGVPMTGSAAASGAGGGAGAPGHGGGAGGDVPGAGAGGDAGGADHMGGAQDGVGGAGSVGDAGGPSADPAAGELAGTGEIVIPDPAGDDLPPAPPSVRNPRRRAAIVLVGAGLLILLAALVGLASWLDGDGVEPASRGPSTAGPSPASGPAVPPSPSAATTAVPTTTEARPDTAAPADTTATPSPSTTTTSSTTSTTVPAKPTTIDRFSASAPRRSRCEAGAGDVTLTWASDGATATLTDPDGATTAVEPSGSATRCARSDEIFILVVTSEDGLRAEARAQVPGPEG